MPATLTLSRCFSSFWVHLTNKLASSLSFQTLLNHKALVNAQNNAGDTPLHKASWRNQYEAVKLLVDAGSDLQKENREGKNPFALARSTSIKKIGRSFHATYLNWVHNGMVAVAPAIILAEEEGEGDSQ